jgi:UDP-2,3-diacylglucosamine pyrophosphatase LpxH
MDIVVLGHFHTERLQRFDEGDPGKTLAMLPSWREEWRYFFITAEGESGFRAYGHGEPLLPK